MREQNLLNARQPANEHRRVLAAGRWLCIVVLRSIIVRVCFILVGSHYILVGHKYTLAGGCYNFVGDYYGLAGGYYNFV